MIARLLVANRGEIAVRVFATCERLGIDTVAVFSDADADAPFVRAAGAAVRLERGYLDGAAIIEAAQLAGADAIHPGYGFLAENAEFAQAVIDAGLTWVGPSPAAIAAMGSKIAARERMEAAGVPVLPGAAIGEQPSAELVERIGFPLLVKASAGGGGKGMRVVREPAALARAIAAARREATNAFGDGTLFLERYLDGARHVEVQIMGDAHGTVVSLFERDCSIQRRHQKVVEEAPSPAVDADLRARMGAAAVAAGRDLGYTGAATVEFLLAADGRFYFLEVNTRLQVEHPVTELVTGLDLVELQLRVAEGAPLPPEALAATLTGHAIEVRLYAEDPANGFLPATGTLTRFELPAGVRVDTGVESGSEIGTLYDPMIAKVAAHAPTREAAARKLATALRHAAVHGLTTNRDFLVRVLEDPAFRSADVDTGYLEREEAAALARSLLDDEQERLHAAAAELAAQAARRAAAPVLGSLPSGWRNNASELQHARYQGASGEFDVGYRFDRHGALAELTLDGEPVEGARLYGAEPGAVELEAGGVRRRYAVHRSGAAVHVNSAAGQARLLALPRFASGGPELRAGSLLSPLPGAVIKVHVAEGEQVERGAPLLVIEAMKMEHEITANADGAVVQLLARQGDQVQAGALLVVIEPRLAD